MRNQPDNSIEAVFHAAGQHAAGPERQAYLDGACGADLELRARVEALLAAEAEASQFLEDPAVESNREGPGSTIGSYKLLQEIGEGGMGVVYMAEQEHPVRRKVALKVIKLGMDTKQVIARFEAERQALAMMEHANIARVFDAGATETGRPYFVMELVRGVPIHEYCDTHKLTTGQRLKLFVEVCQAVQHAHQKGIIHRDLKPNNVMVTSHDGKPVPKIIDFGVAKATNQKLTERTLFTEYHQIIGTPEYMSPEQAEMSGLDVDTRSDIYSLGVLLYQLLTGTTPVDPRDLRTAAFAEMTRMIREDEPQPPSTRISRLGDDGANIALRRKSDLRSLSKGIRGDLDWIAMKALEKDRTRRYDSASAFAEDVSRHLENLPVQAGPPGGWYRLNKFVRRNRKTVAATAVFLAVIALGLAGTSAGFLKARSEAGRSTRISNSLQNVLAMSDAARGADRTEVEGVLAEVRETFGEDHATYAAVLQTLASRLHDAGDLQTASELCRESLEVWTRVYGERHPSVGSAFAQLATIVRTQGNEGEAIAALRSALAVFEEGSQSQAVMGYEARIALADLLSNRGEFEEAGELLEQVLEIMRGSSSPLRFRILQVLEKQYLLQSNQPYADSLATLKSLREESKDFYPENSPVLGIWTLALGRRLVQEEDVEQAEPYLREAVESFRAGPDHTRLFYVSACDALFQLLRKSSKAKDLIESDELLREILRVENGILGLRESVSSRKHYANRMLKRRRFAEALEVLLGAHDRLHGQSGFEDLRESIRDSLTAVAGEAAMQANLATDVYDRALEAIERALAEEPEHAAMRVVSGAVLYRLNDFAAALEALDLPQSLRRYPGGLARRIYPADHAFRSMAYAQLGQEAEAVRELKTLRAALDRNSTAADGIRLVREVELLVEQILTTPTDD